MDCSLGGDRSRWIGATMCMVAGDILGIAREKMGHFITVRNRLPCWGPLDLECNDCPWERRLLGRHGHWEREYTFSVLRP